jgi:hypothetical protein
MNTYRLKMYAYCGMMTPVCEGTLAECRAKAATWIYHHRNTMEYPVSILLRGHEWELETGDDAVMVGDKEGILKIVRVKRGR